METCPGHRHESSETRSRLWQARRILVDHDLRAREGIENRLLDLVGNGVGPDQRDIAIELEMELDEGQVAGGPGPEVMQVAHRGVGERDIANARAVRVRQLAV